MAPQNEAINASTQSTSWKDWPEDRDDYTTQKGNPTPKWRGVSLTHVRDTLQRIEDIEAPIRDLTRILSPLQTILKREQEHLETVLSAALGEDVIIDRHRQCLDSPVSQCFYPQQIEHSTETFCLCCGADMCDYEDYEAQQNARKKRKL